MTQVSKIIIFIYWIFYISILFPYTSIVHFGTDVSPMYIIFLFIISIYYLFKPEKIFLIKNLNLFYFTLSLILSLGIISIISGFLINNFTIIRYGSGYFLFSFTFFILYNVGKRIFIERKIKFINNIVKYFFYAVLIWFFFGILQFVFKSQGSSLGFEISNYFVTSDISHRISDNRGILSLSVEPSYLGLTVGIFISFLYFLKKMNLVNSIKFKFIFLLLLFLIIASFSVVSFMAIFVLLLTILIAEKNIKSFVSLLVFIFIIIILFFIFYEEISNTRLITLSNKILNDPEVLIVDLSSASRAAAIIAPQMSLGYDNIWTGFLCAEQNEILKQAISSFGGEISYYLTLGVENSNKIKSTYGVFVFQYGIIGLITLILLFISTVIIFYGHILKSLPFLGMMHFSYLVQVPMTNPLIPGLMAIMLILIENNRIIKNYGEKNV